jgi:hypothetical protein
MPLGGQTGLLGSYRSASFNYSIEVEHLNFLWCESKGQACGCWTWKPKNQIGGEATGSHEKRQGFSAARFACACIYRKRCPLCKDQK